MATDRSHELWLFTMRFPFGTGEAFLESELPELCSRFERVVLMPQMQEGTARPLPPNARVEPPLADPYATAGPVLMLREVDTYMRLARELRAAAPDRDMLRAQWPELRSRIRQFIHRAAVLRKGALSHYDPSRVLLYTYWWHDWATVLAMLRHRDPRIRFVSRAHGFDLYEERSTDGWIPFRRSQLQQVERVFCASQAGLDHLRAAHPEAADRFELARLGTTDHGMGPVPTGSGPVHLVSCANLVPLKRLQLLVDAIARVEVPVVWTHFGDGPGRAALEEAIAALPTHVEARLKGALPNAEILAWYRREPVDLFVHLSASEGGVPVALQEAASFGIPLLAADAGGVRELVGTGTGILLPPDPTAAQVAGHIDAHRSGPWATAVARSGVRAFWEQHFRATDNHGRFAERLLALAGESC